MSVQTTLNRVDFTPDGATTAFAYSFNVYTQSDLQVYRTALNSVAVLSTLNGAGTYDYTQTVANTPGSSVTGGTVTFNNAPLSTDKITLLRSVPIKQATSFSNFDKFDAKSTLEQQLDLGVMVEQQINETLSRSLSWPVNANAASGSLPDPTIAANQGLALGIKADGSGIGTMALPGAISLPLTVTNGGTGATTVPTNGKILIGNGTAYVAATITAGTGITVTNGAGSITLATALSSKVITFTRDHTATSGTQAITGVGFKPTAAIVMVGFDASPFGTSWSIIDSAGTMGMIYWNGGVAADTWGPTLNRVVYTIDSAGVSQSAVWTSWDADGMTLTWTKSGAPAAGNDTGKILFIR